MGPFLQFRSTRHMRTVLASFYCRFFIPICLIIIDILFVLVYVYSVLGEGEGRGVLWFVESVRL